MKDYVSGCVERLIGFAEKNDELGTAARVALGQNLDSLLLHDFVDTMGTVVERIGCVVGTWPDALESLDRFLRVNAAKLDYDRKSNLEELIASLEPSGLEANVYFLVTMMPPDFPPEEEMDFEARCQYQREIVREVADECVRVPTVLKKVLSRLSRGEQRMAYVFGESIANSVESPLDWLDRIERAVVEVPKDERNFELLYSYVAGIVKSYPDAVDEFKRRAARSPELAPALPSICTRLGVVSSDIDLVVSALEKGLLPPLQLSLWQVNSMHELPVPAVATLFDAMLDQGGDSFVAVIRLMTGYISDEIDRLDDLRPQVRACAENVAKFEFSLSGMRFNYYFEQIMKWMLEQGRQDPDARATALALADAVVERVELDDDGLLQSLIPMLLTDFPDIVWSRIGQAIISARRERRFQYFLFQRLLREDSYRGRRLILHLPEETMLSWCHAYPEYAPAFMATVVPVLTAYYGFQQSLHPYMTRLLDEFGDREDVRQAISGNIHTFHGKGTVYYYQFHLESLKALRDHKNAQVRCWSETMLKSLDEAIKAADIYDYDEEGRGRFEF